MARLRIANNYNSSLVSSIDTLDTEIIVASVTGAPVIDVEGDYFLLTLVNLSGEYEIVKVVSTDLPNNTFTIVRAQENTVAHNFPVDSKLGNRFTAGSYDTYLESFHIRVDAEPTRVDDTTITFVDDISSIFQVDRSIRVIDDAGTEYDMYVVSSVYTTLTTVVVDETLPATVEVVELGVNVDWLPRSSNAATAAYATEAGNAATADLADLATLAVGIQGKTISTTSGGAADVIPLTPAGGVLDGSFLPVVTAGAVTYTNTTSGLTATDVQAAIDEVDGVVDVLPRKTEANTWTKTQVVGKQTLTDAANIAWDASLGNVAVVTLTTDRILDNPTNLVAGGTYILIVTSGDFQLTYGTLYAFPENEIPVLVGKCVLSFVYDGTNMLGVSTADIRNT